MEVCHCRTEERESVESGASFETCSEILNRGAYVISRSFKKKKKKKNSSHSFPHFQRNSLRNIQPNIHEAVPAYHF